MNPITFIKNLFSKNKVNKSKFCNRKCSECKLFKKDDLFYNLGWCNVTGEDHGKNYDTPACDHFQSVNVIDMSKATELCKQIIAKCKEESNAQEAN